MKSEQINSYKDLDVWNEAIELTIMIYELSMHFPKDELYGLTNQIRRSASSIPANIAEGWGRISSKEFKRFLLIARGSAMETETHLIIAVKLDYINRDSAVPIWKQIEKVNKLLFGTIRSIENKAR